MHLFTECGTAPIHSNAFSPYIIHGEDAAPGQWPWQIELDREGAFACGGSIIDHYWILTAAHCVSSVPLVYYMYFYIYLAIIRDNGVHYYAQLMGDFLFIRL